MDYAQFSETLRSYIDPILKKRLGENHSGVTQIVTGTAPIVFRARRSLLDGMLFGLGTDVVLIVVAVILTTRSWLTGAVMFVLSVFPTTLVFGAMGLLGIVVDIGSVMTPCVAVGVTVDDVIHFLLCHRRGVQQGLSTGQAAILAYRTCGRAMIQSWGISVSPVNLRLWSSYLSPVPFGMLMLLAAHSRTRSAIWCFSLRFFGRAPSAAGLRRPRCQLATLVQSRQSPGPQGLLSGKSPPTKVTWRPA